MTSKVSKFGQFWIVMEKKTEERIMALLSREVKPALGCTEPIAVAIAVARAADVWPELKVERVNVQVSANILKNAMGVGIPGTGATGLPMAVAMALTCGDWHYGLEVLKDVSSSAVADAREIVSEGRVDVSVAKNDSMLYAEAECIFSGGHSSCAVVRDEHDNIVSVSQDGVVVYEGSSGSQEVQCHEDGSFLTLEMIDEFASSVELSALGLIREQVRLNSALSEEGLKGGCGLSVGYSLLHNDIMNDSLSTQCMARTAAASDARMSGSVLPAMSNSGSGNQGIAVSMPVIAASRYFGATEEEMLRALVLSNLVAIHIKSYLGRLSALCGCVVASVGSSCGIVKLKGGGVDQMSSAIKNMIGSITGMLCDGAKEGCAMKVASGVSCALQSAVLALNGICAKSTDGIIDDDLEKTIHNLGNIGSQGMTQTDRMVLDIMVCK